MVNASGPDLGAVGNAASASKKSVAEPQELTSFSVKKGDNGGVIVCETYEKKAPAGRRASSYFGGGDYKENPFSPDDGGAATSHITGLLSQMGIAAAAPPDLGPPPDEMGPPPPSMTAMRGPNAGAVSVSGPVDGPSGGGDYAY